MLSFCLPPSLLIALFLLLGLSSPTAAQLTPDASPTEISLEKLIQDKPKYYFRKLSKAYGHYTRHRKDPEIKTSGYIAEADPGRRRFRLYTQWDPKNGCTGDSILVFVSVKNQQEFMHPSIQNAGYQVTVIGEINVIPVRKYFEIKARKVIAEPKLAELLKTLPKQEELITNN